MSCSQSYQIWHQSQSEYGFRRQQNTENVDFVLANTIKEILSYVYEMKNFCTPNFDSKKIWITKLPNLKS